MSVLWRINEDHNAELHQKVCYVVVDLLDERNDFLIKVQDTLAYKHELCMKKGTYMHLTQTLML